MSISFIGSPFCGMLILEFDVEFFLLKLVSHDYASYP